MRYNYQKKSERRKVHIEWASETCVTLTTPYFQRTFYISEPIAIDLISLKRFDLKYADSPKKVYYPFFVKFVSQKQGFEGEIFALTSPDRLENVSFCSFHETNPEIFELTIWVDK